jgi:hypothetical protein
MELKCVHACMFFHAFYYCIRHMSMLRHARAFFADSTTAFVAPHGSDEKRGNIYMCDVNVARTAFWSHMEIYKRKLAC